MRNFSSHGLKKYLLLEPHVRPTVLIIDGQGSHITYSVIKTAVEENIKIILIAPYTTNVLQSLQSLDVGLFRSLKENLSKVTDKVKMLSVIGDYQNINKTNFTAIFKESFERSMSLATIKNGFRKIRIYPFNPKAIDKTRLIPIEPSTSLTPITATSSLPGVESTPDENLEKSEHDFTITSSENTFGHSNTKHCNKYENRAQISSRCILPAIK